MGTINRSNVSDGTSIDAADLNTDMNTVFDEFNGGIDNANIASDAAIAKSKIDLGTSQSWTPTFTNFTLGNGTINFAKYLELGDWVLFEIKVTLGSTSSVSGVIQFTPPVAMSADYSEALVDTVGDAFFRSSNTFLGNATWQTGGDIALRVTLANDTYAKHTTSSATVPFTWAATHHFEVRGKYRKA